MMRGAALKLGQFMSIQGADSFFVIFKSTISSKPSFIDSHLLPKDVEEIFRRVQDSAHYMPNWQMEVSVILKREHAMATRLNNVSVYRVSYPNPLAPRGHRTLLHLTRFLLPRLHWDRFILQCFLEAFLLQEGMRKLL